MTEENGRQQCHLCLLFWKFLGSHLRAHVISADEYKADFGLNRGQPLMSGETYATRRAIGQRLKDEGVLISGEEARPNLERYHGIACRYERRLQERLGRSEALRGNDIANKSPEEFADATFAGDLVDVSPLFGSAIDNAPPVFNEKPEEPIETCEGYVDEEIEEKKLYDWFDVAELEDDLQAKMNETKRVAHSGGLGDFLGIIGAVVPYSFRDFDVRHGLEVHDFEVPALDPIKKRVIVNGTWADTNLYGDGDPISRPLEKVRCEHCGKQCVAMLGVTCKCGYTWKGGRSWVKCADSYVTR